MTLPADELLALYAELSRELAPLQESCRACGQCCDFGTHGEILYATRLERDVLALAGAAPAAAKGAHADALVCPYCVEGKCSARNYRALGCRTYYCREPTRSAGMSLYEKYRARLAEICRRHGVEWDYRMVMEALGRLPARSTKK